MGLTILTGRAASGKSTEVYQRMGALHKRGVPTLLLVPEQFTLQAERELLRTLDLPGMLDMAVMSVSRFQEDVFSRVGAPQTALLDAHGRTMALRRVAMSQAEHLRLYQAVARRGGFAARVASLVTEFKRYDLQPQDLRQAAGELEGGFLGRKLQDLADLYEGLGALMADCAYEDEEDRMNDLIAALPRDRTLQGLAVFLDGFDYLPPQSLRLVAALSRACVAVTLTLALGNPGDRDAALFGAGARNLEALRGMALDWGFDVDVVALSSRKAQRASGRHPALQHLERELFAYPTRPYAGPPAPVRLVRAANPEEEVEAAAAALSGWVRQDPTLRWRDMAVACGDLEGYQPRIARIFARHGIDCFLDDRRPILTHPAVEYLLGCLRLLDRNWRTADVLRLLKTGLTGLDMEACEQLEIYLTALEFAGAERYRRPFRRQVEGLNAPLEDLNAWREQAFAPVWALQRRVGEEAAGPRWAEALQGLLEEHLSERLQGQEELDGQVLEALEQLLQQLPIMLPDTELTAREVLELLEEGCADVTVGVLPTAADAVLIGDIGRTKVAGLRRLLVLGAVDGALPAYGAPEGLLANRDVAALRGMGLPVGRDAAQLAVQSRMEVYAALSKPTEGLYISYPTGDDDGAAKQPSALVARIAGLLDVTVEEAELWQGHTPAALLRPVAAALREAAAGGAPSGPWRQAVAALQQEGSQAGQVAAMLRAQQPQPLGLDAAQLLPLASATSASRLEDYARCPFQFLVTYGLAPQAWPDNTLDAIGAGLYLHEAAARFGRLAAERGETSPEGLERLMEEVTEPLTEEIMGEELLASGRGRFMAEQLQAICRRSAQTYARQLRQGDFTPRFFEVAFQNGLELGPISLDLPGGGQAQLSGKIDRVDVLRREDADYLRVIDYKSRGETVDLAAAMGGWQIQLWLYMDALCNAWPRLTGRPAKPAGLFYAPLQDRFAQPKPGQGDEAAQLAERMNGLCLDDPAILAALDRDLSQPGQESRVVNLKTNARGSAGAGGRSAQDLQAIATGVREQAALHLDAIRRGEVAPQPLREGQRLSCQQCPYGALCQMSVYGGQVKRPPTSQEVEAWIAQHKEDTP